MNEVPISLTVCSADRGLKSNSRLEIRNIFSGSFHVFFFQQKEKKNFVLGMYSRFFLVAALLPCCTGVCVREFFFFLNVGLSRVCL